MTRCGGGESRLVLLACVPVVSLPIVAPLKICCCLLSNHGQESFRAAEFKVRHYAVLAR